MDNSVSAEGCAQITPDLLARELRDLPLSIRVLPKLKRLLQDGNSSMFAIVSLLRLDPGLAARILRIGNSAYFGGGYRCTTLEEAVARVGYQQIYETVGYAVASQVLVRPVPVYSLEAESLWQRSVACALAAELLANACGVDRSEAYTVGLLHNVGLIAIDDWVGKHLPGVVFSAKSFPHEWTAAEREHLGFTQAEVGATMLSHWDFPESINIPVQWQYAPRAASAYQQLTSILFLARWVRTMVCEQPAVTPPAPDPMMLAQVGLSTIGLCNIIGEVQVALRQVNSMLQTDQPELARLKFPARM